MNDYQIDHSVHQKKGFRLIEGQEVHLISPDGRKSKLHIKDLIVDETPYVFGSESEVGQVAETTDGRWVLCVDGEDASRGLAIDVFDSRKSLTRWLWDNMCNPAAYLLILWCLNAIQLHPASWEPDLASNG